MLHLPPEAWGAIADEVVDLLGPSHAPPTRVIVPSLVGMRVSEARFLAMQYGVRLDVSRDTDGPPAVEGRVIKQEPTAGVEVKRNSRVSVLLHFDTNQASRAVGNTQSYYEVLGVTPGASADEIERAWRRQAMKLHPDHGGNVEEFLRAAEAYRVLARSDRRAAYDEHLQSLGSGAQ